MTDNRNNKQDFINNLIMSAASDPMEKEKLLKNPKQYIQANLNFVLPDDFEVAVHEDTPTRLNIVLPLANELSEAELSGISGGVCWSYSPDDCEAYNVHSDIKLKKNIAGLE